MLEKIVSSLLIVGSTIFMWYHLNDEKANIKRTMIVYLLSSVLITVNYILVANSIKTVISTLIMIFAYYFIFKDKIRNVVATPIFTQAIILISELIFVIVMALLLNLNNNNILDTIFGKLMSNIIISIMAILISLITYTKRLYKFIIRSINHINSIGLIIFCLAFVTIANLLTSYIYYQTNIVYLIISNILCFTLYMVIITIYFKTNNNYINVYAKYNNTLSSLKEYEDILSRYRVSNHENKNQLLTIRGMVRNKKVTSYIDEIVENKIKDNEKLMFESLAIPEGGLRGLIYSKLLLMKENNIEYDLSVDKNVKTSELLNIDDKLLLNICNITGVYLDNAIEEVKNLEDKYVSIEIYYDDTLNIAISNNYEGQIDLDEIDKKGYTTKSNGHGYGLSLVKEILEKDKRLKNVKRLSDDIFTQELKIKM